MMSDTLSQHLKLRQSFFRFFLIYALRTQTLLLSRVATLDIIVYFIKLKSILTHQHTKGDVTPLLSLSHILVSVRGVVTTFFNSLSSSSSSSSPPPLCVSLCVFVRILCVRRHSYTNAQIWSTEDKSQSQFFHSMFPHFHIFGG